MGRIDKTGLAAVGAGLLLMVVCSAAYHSVAESNPELVGVSNTAQAANVGGMVLGFVASLWGAIKPYLGKATEIIRANKGGVTPELGGAVASWVYLSEYLKGDPAAKASLETIWGRLAAPKESSDAAK